MHLPIRASATVVALATILLVRTQPANAQPSAPRSTHEPTLSS
jgi:hypothetical protein